MRDAANAPAQDYTSQNVTFWDELCGSVLARSIGVTDASESSLARFDRAYLDFYPYLLGHVRPKDAAGSRVVEVGLGYGTVGQQFLDAGAHYTGVDVARGPAAMMNHRAQLMGRSPCAVRGSALALPVPSNSVDYFVSIGCFHHTGSVERCVAEAYRVLRPGGTAIVMVYNQFSYRHWTRWPVKTARTLFARHAPEPAANAPVHQRKEYDANAKGEAAPGTVFFSVNRIKQVFGPFSSTELVKENNSNLLRFIPRQSLLNTLGRYAGLDIYIRAVK
jgi:SAM-dependent methyltransferase